MTIALYTDIISALKDATKPPWEDHSPKESTDECATFICPGVQVKAGPRAKPGPKMVLSGCGCCQSPWMDPADRKLVLLLVNNARELLDALAAKAQADGYRIFKDGDQWCAVGPGFKNLQDSPAGFGRLPKWALEELVKLEVAQELDRLKEEAEGSRG